MTICSDFGAPKIESGTVSTVSPSIFHEVMEPDAMIFVSWTLSFQPTFSLFSFTFIKRMFSSSSLSAIRVASSAYLSLLIFLQQSQFQLVLHSVFSFIQWMLPIWSQIPLPFLNFAWTSVCSLFMYSWSLACRILSITLLVCDMSAIVW